MTTDFCFRCGQCCREQRFTFTREEAELIERQTHVRLMGKEKRPNRFQMPDACPFLKDKACSIYAIRPCQCRIYHCGRLHPNDEKVKWLSEIRTLISNNLEYKEYKEFIEKEGVEWGNKHGWNWKHK